MRFLLLAPFSTFLLLANPEAPKVRADEIPAKYRPVIQKGLDYLAKQQQPDGHWENSGGGYVTGLTALCGMALLMEGSTLQGGKYASNIRKAVTWFMERSQRNGLLLELSSNGESNRYMFGHGYGLMFLASAYGEEENGPERKKLEAILTRAVNFTANAQLPCGGWYYTSELAGTDCDELCVTACQLQGLRAAKSAGIAVPKSVLDKARAYLKQATTPAGGVVYSLSSAWVASPSLTPVAIVSYFSAGDYSSALAKKWIAYCRRSITIGGIGPETKIWSYTHYHYAQVIYSLGDDGYVRLFPQSRPDERMTWTKYRRAVFDYIASCQSADGSCEKPDCYGGLLTSAFCLTILQLDNGAVPLFQR